MTRTGAAARPDMEERAQDFMEWAELHSRQLSVVAAALIVIAGGIWFYAKSRAARAANASAALVEAEQAVEAGNMPLAQNDLERIVSRYAETNAGRQAQLLLGKVLFERGQFQGGIAALQKLAATKDEFAQAEAYNLIGAGYEQEQKYDSAAASYRRAAETARFPEDRDGYLANAARALAAGGKTADAVAIWKKIAADPKSTAAAEAKVRLGELEAKAVPKG